MPKKINFNSKGVIFDLDDTIANTKRGKNQALKIVSLRIYNYLRKKGRNVNLDKLTKMIRIVSEEMDKKEIFDRNLWWTAIFEKFLKKVPSKSVLNNLTQLYWKMVMGKGTLYKDTLSILTYLKNKGYILGLLTDTDAVKRMKLKRIEALNLKKRFDSIVVAGEDTKKTKLNPAPFYSISKKLNLKPEQCVFIGNNPFSEILGAKKAGMATILIKRQRCRIKIKPSQIIKSLSQLKDIL